jgi:dephospho-CoA kinase
MSTAGNAILKIGVTGGIGSGKTMVCRIFEKLGIAVYHADAAAASIVNSDEGLIFSIRSVFGNEIYDEKNVLNRKKLSDIVFNDPLALQKLNALVHPAVFRHFDEWFVKQKNQPYVIKEAAIMFESGAFRQMDFIINVSAPENLRISRVCSRDGLEPDAVRLRIRNQMSDEDRSAKSDFVIFNDDSQLLMPQILKIHEVLLKKALPGIPEK